MGELDQVKTIESEEGEFLDLKIEMGLQLTIIAEPHAKGIEIGDIIKVTRVLWHNNETTKGDVFYNIIRGGNIITEREQNFTVGAFQWMFLRKIADHNNRPEGSWKFPRYFFVEPVRSSVEKVLAA